MPYPARFLIPLLICLCVFNFSAAAQAPDSPRPLSTLVKAWNSVLEEADQSLLKPEVADERLEELRAEVAKLRLDAIAAADGAAPDVQLIRDELQALGPPPAEGQPPDSPSVVSKRKAIVEKLAAAEGTIKETELVIARADRILGQSATLRRQRFTERVLARGPSPVSAAIWKKAGSDDLGAIQACWTGMAAWFQSPALAQQGWRLAANLALALVAALTLSGLLRRWLTHRYGYVSVATEPSHRQRLRTALVAGLVRSLMPAGATLSAYFVLRASDLLDDAGVLALRAALLALMSFYFVAAFSRAALAPFDPDWRIVGFGDQAARSVSRMVTALALVFALDWVIDTLGEQYGASLEQVIVHKLLSGLVVAGLLLALLSESIWHAPAERFGAELAQRVWHRLRWLLRLLVLSIPVSALLGYVALSRVLATQLVLTPAILLGATLARRICAESIGHLFSRHSAWGQHLRLALSLTDEGCEMLGFWLNEAVGLVILLTAFAALLVLWGAGRDDIAGWAYDAFIGFKIGNVTLSLADILLAILLFAVLLTATRLFQRMLEHRLFPRTRLDLGVRNSIRAAVGYLGFLLAGAVAVSIVGIDLNNLAIIAGALSVGIGFGLQNIVNNFVSGLILLVERPIKCGDWVVVGEHQGHVRKISVRATEITTFDRASVFIPNSNLIASPVMNRTYADKVGRVVLPVGVAYGSEASMVRDLLLDIVGAHPDVLKNPAPQVQFRSFSENTIHLEIVAFIPDVDRVKSVTSDLGFEIDAVFRREGIQMTVPQRDVHVLLREDQLEKLIGALTKVSNRAPSMETRCEPAAVTDKERPPA
ncbi:DUF3772 domain-containing protein [Methylococcus sp. EFPC2]|uniref:DUF3772 domain-containing protein n=1 Tax=Methylococcus sp. EFPC2 TaxID=2812648 RepID=UPI0019678297|nr:DUF3772 domain-containing protein [Methylococcus sp. EFPC2]QSA96054.1 mechanosensitive ion channel family protein [Methylococcus sp. EFPC2]